MLSVIAAHCENLETWQSFSLLYDKLPLYKNNHSVELFGINYYTISPNYEAIGDFEIVIKTVLTDFMNEDNIKKTVKRRFTLYLLTRNISFRDDIYEDGQLIKRSEYNSEHLIEKKNYKNGKLHGNYRLYYNNGQIYSKCKYIEGKLHGEYIDYYMNGNIKKKCNYINNKRNGELKIYSVNGNLIVELTYENDERQGEIKVYDLNNKIKLRGFYDKNVPTGIWGSYNDEGEFEKSSKYIEIIDKMLNRIEVYSEIII